MKHAAMALLAAVAVTTAWSQEPPEIDRNDPRAVAEAYVQACREGNIDAAVSLLAPDEAAGEVVKEFAEKFADEGAPGNMGLTMDDIFMEFQFTPVPLNMDRQFAEAVEEGAQARVTFKSGFAFDQNIVLVRQEDGTWAIDFFASITATTGREKSFFETEMSGRGRAQQEAMAPAQMQAQMQAMLERPSPGTGQTGPMRKLHGFLLEYARDHDGQFPPTETWMDAVELYALDRALFRNPDAPDGEGGYAINVDLGGKRVDELWAGDAEAQDILLLIEWPTAERNAVVNVDDLPDLRSVRADKTIRYVTCLGDQGVLREGMTWDEARPAGPVETATEADEFDQQAWEHYSTCQRNLQALTVAARRYATQHEGLLPPADAWQDEIALILLELETQMPWLAGGDDPGGIVRCPAAPDLDFAYAINADVAGRNALELAGHDEIILFFECDLNVPNAAGSPTRDATPPRHRLPGRDAPLALVGYLSGVVEELTQP